MTRRQLHVAPEVAQRLPAAHLAQLQAVIDDPDNRCTACGQPITCPTAEAILLTDGDFIAVRLAHPTCVRSGIYQASGLRTAEAQRLADGLDITTSVALRPGAAPRALVLIELVDNISLVPDGDLLDRADPLADYAAALGLTPISGQLDQVTPAQTTTSRLHVDPDAGTLCLIHPHGQDIICDDDPHGLAAWTQIAAADHATALVITARGLGLTQQPTTIEEAIATRPAYAAQVTVTGLPHPHPHPRCPRRITRKRRAS